VFNFRLAPNLTPIFFSPVLKHFMRLQGIVTTAAKELIFAD